ncbi:hypothetical protein FQR65_LT01629 [Abscondita terminalis]|nr:hypothetical protein FQR65_LT01629 [Abscondita terminalis]
MHRKGPENIIINTNSSTQRTRGSGRTPGIRILSQISSGSIRRAAGGGGGHNHSCPGNYCGGSSGSYMNASQPRQADYHSFRPNMTHPPQQSFNVPARHETFGSQMDYNLSWMPKDVDLGNPVDASFLMAAHAQHKNQTGKYFTKESNLSGPSGFEHNDPVPASKDSRYLLNQQTLRDADASQCPKSSARRESLLEWFDRTVELELKRRRDASLNVGENMINLATPSFNRLDKGRKYHSNPLLCEASTSGMDINASLREDQDTELLLAVDKLAKAEAMCTFEGAVRAAEEAAASAPPEHVEEAAAAGAQGFEARLTGVIKQQIDGVKPVEVIGYVGITKPNKPKKSN